MSYTFEAGDIVELKSGGPKMTVELVTEKDQVILVHCTWSENGTYFEKNFNEKLLIKYKAPESSGYIGRA